MLQITPTLSIDESELEERFVRASGPGGQNVNKVATAVQLRFDPVRCGKLDAEELQRLRVLAGSRMTAGGLLVIDARRHRTQAQNREDARRRLAELLRQALVKPKRRRKTKPSQSSVDRRLQSKRLRSDTKRGRGSISRDE